VNGRSREIGEITNNSSQEGAAMAWGILMAAMTVFGMLGLLIAAVRMEDQPPCDRTEAKQAGHAVSSKQAA
jgi:hypothetical protein